MTAVPDGMFVRIERASTGVTARSVGILSGRPALGECSQPFPMVRDANLSVPSGQDGMPIASQDLDKGECRLTGGWPIRSLVGRVGRAPTPPVIFYARFKPATGFRVRA